VTGFATDFATGFVTGFATGLLGAVFFIRFFEFQALIHYDLQINYS
jgi:hypothetical protein